MISSDEKSNESLGHIGGYELIDLIGRGGMGVVYKAKQIGLDRIVAVKTVLGDHASSPEDKLRFRSEAIAAASLRHSGIVSIHDFGEHDGRPYFSMDFVDGPTLAAFLRTATMPSREASELIGMSP